MDPFLIGMFDDGCSTEIGRQDGFRPVERPIVKFASQGSSEESDQSSNFTAYDIWCAGLSPETFPLIGSDIEPYRR
jgi:hypothetical protein